MDTALNRTSLKFGVPGLVTLHVGMFFPMALGYKHPPDVPAWMSALSWAGIICGEALFVVGLEYYAAAKGHSRWAGLLGLLSLIGYLVLAVLPDRHKTPPAPRT